MSDHGESSRASASKNIEGLAASLGADAFFSTRGREQTAVAIEGQRGSSRKPFISRFAGIEKAQANEHVSLRLVNGFPSPTAPSRLIDRGGALD